jgi:protein-tyrosine phosphatase
MKIYSNSSLTAQNSIAVVENKDKSLEQNAGPIGKVDLFSLSYFNSDLFKIPLKGMVAATITLGISTLLPADLLTVSKTAVFGAGLALYIAAESAVRKKQLLYEISLLYTILGSKDWWNQINDHIIVGAIPLEQHRDQLKQLGVTHVITMLEDFETRKGLARPISKEEWETYEIENKKIDTADFYGVPPDKLQEAVDYMRAVRQKNPKAMFYIHCKAGRGRSVSVVVSYLSSGKIDKQPGMTVSELPSCLKNTISEVKESRPQINLNANQQQTISECLRLYLHAVTAAKEEAKQSIAGEAAIGFISSTEKKFEEIEPAQTAEAKALENDAATLPATEKIEQTQKDVLEKKSEQVLATSSAAVAA